MKGFLSLSLRMGRSLSFGRLPIFDPSVPARRPKRWEQIIHPQMLQRLAYTDTHYQLYSIKNIRVNLLYMDGNCRTSFVRVKSRNESGKNVSNKFHFFHKNVELTIFVIIIIIALLFLLVRVFALTASRLHLMSHTVTRAREGTHSHWHTYTHTCTRTHTERVSRLCV